MIAYSVAVFLLGTLAGSVVGGAFVLKEHMRRQHVDPRTLRSLTRERI